MVFEDKKVLIIGMARSGLAVAKTLVELGADVSITDQKNEVQLKELIKSISDLPVKVFAGNYPEVNSKKFDLIVTSPGVPMNALPLQKAVEGNIKVWSEIELAAHFCESPIIAVTGTNGKTTTTSLIGQMFIDAGKKTIIGGNIGSPLINQAVKAKDNDVNVVEVSSFQLEWIESFCPYIAIITNITPDHLDRHGNVENYAKVKSNIFINQNKNNYTILNYDDEIVRDMNTLSSGKVLYFSRKHILEKGIFIDHGKIIIKTEGKQLEIVNIDDIKIPGGHNLENTLAAVGAAYIFGLSIEDISRTLSTFEGVEHRLEKVAIINGVKYINDSKGTNPDASIKALEAFKEPILLIAGGSTKNSDFSEFAKIVKKKAKYTIVLGETKEEIAKALDNVNYRKYIEVDTFKDAINKAESLANSGDIVLLSPACASYDMFDNYEHRGEVFKELVLAKK